MNLFKFKETKPVKLLKTVIIDDEPHIRDTLLRMIKLHCPQIHVSGAADGVKSGIKLIEEKKPDLVLLDIEMGDGTGFDLLEYFGDIDFKVIFVTAYEEYVMEAFRFSAVDYILKPVSPDKLEEAVERANHIVQKSFRVQLKTLEENLNPENRQQRKIILKTQENIYLIKLSDIVYCVSDGNYTTFHILGQKPVLVSKTLKEFDNMLSDHGFFRVHRSYLINLQHINRFDKHDGGYVILADDHKVPVASRSKDRLLELFDELAG